MLLLRVRGRGAAPFLAQVAEAAEEVLASKLLLDRLGERGAAPRFVLLPARRGSPRGFAGHVALASGLRRPRHGGGLPTFGHLGGVTGRSFADRRRVVLWILEGQRQDKAGQKRWHEAVSATA